jgi:hypothetical protein
MKTVLLTEQHVAYSEWLNRLAFYKDELKIMQNRIAEIAERNTKTDVLAQVEHFQNMLIIQKNQIDRLRHDTDKQEEELVSLALKNPVASDHRRVEFHPEQKQKIELFEKIFNELRHELIHWLTKVM